MNLLINLFSCSIEHSLYSLTSKLHIVFCPKSIEEKPLNSFHVVRCLHYKPANTLSSNNYQRSSINLVLLPNWLEKVVCKNLSRLYIYLQHLPQRLRSGQHLVYWAVRVWEETHDRCTHEHSTLYLEHMSRSTLQVSQSYSSQLPV